MGTRGYGLFLGGAVLFMVDWHADFGLLWPAMFTPRLMPIGLLQVVTEPASSIEGRRKKRHEDRSPIEPRRYCEPGMFLPNAPFSGKLGKRLGDAHWPVDGGLYARSGRGLLSVNVGPDLGVVSATPYSTLVASPLPVLPVLDAFVSEPATPECENALSTYQT
jgi:hypothetical protein